MLTSDQFDALNIPITELYEKYSQTVINDIARRLSKMDMSAASAWQVQRLIESGQVFENTLKEISKLTGKSEEVLKQTFEKAGVEAIKFDDSIYKAAGLNPLPLNLSPAMLQTLTAGLSKTNGILNNLTMTTALSSQEAFIRAADMAYLQVTTGAMSYDQAIKAAVKDVGGSGLDVRYPSGHVDKLDVATRRTVLTGVGQTTAELQITRAGEMGQDLVETSAHIGARPSHAEWQGRIFSLSGNHPIYPDFVEGTGYGTGGGLGGWNCRHSFYPYFEGISEAAYTEKERAFNNEVAVGYNGDILTVYEATQEQRYIERTIRKYKREAAALKSAGLDNSAEIGKVREWQKKARELVDQTGLRRQYARETIGGLVTLTPPKIKEKVK